MLSGFLAVIFIIKCIASRGRRFPNYIKFKYNRQTFVTLRHFESLSIKIKKCEEDLYFLNICSYHNVFPKFIQFKLYKSSLYKSKIYSDTLRSLLNHEISTKEKVLVKIKKQCENASVFLRDNLSWLDFVIINKWVSFSTDRFISAVKLRHERKLQALRISAPKFYEPDSVIFNFSDTILTPRLKFLLSLGLQFGLPCHKYNFYSYFLSFEKLCRALSDFPVYRDNFSFFCNALRSVAFKHFFSPKKLQPHPFIKPSDLVCLKNLAARPNLVVCKPDKGRGVVLLNKSDYVSKLNDILSDANKFKLCEDADPYKLSLKLEDKLNRHLRLLLNSGTLSPDIYSSIFASGTSIGTLYGLPKIHKNNCPLRPVLAAYSTHNFNLAKFLNSILLPLSVNEYTVKSSSSFASLISSLSFPNSYMVSFDVQSLFTNVPLHETINIATDLYVNHSPNPAFDRDTFSTLLKLATLDTFFLCNNAIYEQVDGVAMGSPLGPTLANIFLNHIESSLFNNPSIQQPLLYRRYVDDTFLLFSDSHTASIFFDHCNSMHPNLTFTMETESHDTLSFLDVLVSRVGSNFTTSVFRKPTYTSQSTNFYSFISDTYKHNTCYILIHRAYKICSNFTLFHNELLFLLDFFVNNGYGVDYIFSLIKKYLNNIYYPAISYDVPKFPLYIKFPYIGYPSSLLKSDISKCLSKFYPQVSPKFIFINGNTIGKFFRFKDRLPPLLQSNVVYSYTCPSCMEGAYIGCTSRLLRTRICGHMGVSHRTLLPLSTKEPSPIRAHSVTCKNSIKFSDFKIIKQVPSDKSSFSLLCLESLFIKNLKPSLNSDTSAIPLHIFK